MIKPDRPYCLEGCKKVLIGILARALADFWFSPHPMIRLDAAQFLYSKESDALFELLGLEGMALRARFWKLRGGKPIEGDKTWETLTAIRQLAWSDY